MVTSLILTLTLAVGIHVESSITGSTDVSSSARSTVQWTVCDGKGNGNIIYNDITIYFYCKCVKSLILNRGRGRSSFCYYYVYFYIRAYIYNFGSPVYIKVSKIYRYYINNYLKIKIKHVKQ